MDTDELFELVRRQALQQEELQQQMRAQQQLLYKILAKGNPPSPNPSPPPNPSPRRSPRRLKKHAANSPSTPPAHMASPKRILFKKNSRGKKKSAHLDNLRKLMGMRLKQYDSGFLQGTFAFDSLHVCMY